MVKLEVKNASSTDKGMYKLVAKNEKGEVVSNAIEVKEVAEEKVEKPSIDKKLKSIVSSYESCGVRVKIIVCTLVPLTNETYILAYRIIILYIPNLIVISVMLTISDKKKNIIITL